MTIDSEISPSSSSSSSVVNQNVELVIFDFDQTIIDCNTDTFINQLAPNGRIPVEFWSKNIVWTDYMQKVFNFLHENGIRRDDYCRCFRTMKFVPGMIDLIQNLHKGLPSKGKQFEMIIISDANSFSITEILEQNNLINCFRYVFLYLFLIFILSI